MKVLVTGSSGLVGRALIARLATQSAIRLVCVLRRPLALPKQCEPFLVADLVSADDWTSALQDVQVVVHCAARVHVMKEPDADPLAEYRRVNVMGTLHLARQAALAGVKRFIFISSIKVNGEATADGRPFAASDVPAPEDAYGLSKLEAEQGLTQLAAETGMEVVIIRPPLVYGPGVRGNFARMVKLVSKGFPLPLGAIHNQRSLVGIDNLVDLIIRCMEHPAAANQVFLAGDGQDLSVTELLCGVASAMGKPVRLIPVPAGILWAGSVVLGKKAMAQRLLGSLQVDISKTCELLDWTPPCRVEQGLRRCFEPLD